MLEKIDRIVLKGRRFLEETALPFFEDGMQLAMIYGDNGSGKSTIADALQNVELGAGINGQSDVGCRFETQSGVSVAMEQGDLIESPRIRVFNEKYVDQNVKFVGDGLRTIILLGDNVGIQERIDILSHEIDDEEQELERCRQRYEGTRNDKGKLPSEVKFDEMLQILRKDGGWADRDRFIKDLRNKAAVSPETISLVIRSRPSKSLTELQSEYDDVSRQLNIVRGKSDEEDVTLWPKIEFAPDYKGAEEAAKAAIKFVIDRPMADKDVGRVLAALHERHQDWIDRARVDFSSESTVYCPYCMRDISEVEKRNIVSRINRVLNRGVDEFVDRLRSLTFPPMPVIDGRYAKLNPDYYAEYNRLKDEVSASIHAFQAALENKLNNPFDAIEPPSVDVHGLALKANSFLDKLNWVAD